MKIFATIDTLIEGFSRIVREEIGLAGVVILFVVMTSFLLLLGSVDGSEEASSSTREK